MSSPQHNPKPSVVGSLLRITFKILGWLLLAWFVALLISCIFLTLKGKQIGLIYLQQLLNLQLSYLSQQPLFSLQNDIVDVVIGYLKTIQLFSNHLLFANNLQINSPTFNRLVTLTIAQVNAYSQALLLSTQISLVRITVIGLFLPLLILLTMVGITSGLVARYLRRIQGGRESSLIYHNARIAALPLLLWSWLIFIVLPYNIEPVYILMPASILFAALTYLTIKTFKKYI